MTAAKKLHWTQKPENAETLKRVQSQAVQARHGGSKLVKKTQPAQPIATGLLDKWRELQDGVAQRLEEIEKEIGILQMERDMLRGIPTEGERTQINDD